MNAKAKKSKPRSLVSLKSLPREKRIAVRRKIYDAWQANARPGPTARALRIHPISVHRLYRRFETEGEAAIREKPRGPRTSPKAALTPQQLDQLARAISGGNPKQMLLDFALWSSRAVVAYVASRFRRTLSRRTARRLLQRMGFTYQCPVRRAREQVPAAVKEWLEKTYSRLLRLARRHKAAILWGDEATVQACATKARGYSPRGEAPILRSPANRNIRCNYAAAVDNLGELFFMTYQGAMNADLFRAFLELLMEECGRPIVLIVDNLKVHHANCLQKWFRRMERAGKLWVRYLPSYSPELNPEEYLNRDVKAAAAEKALPATAEEMVEQTAAHLAMRKKSPESVRRIAFGHPKVRYAAGKVDAGKQ